MLTTTEMLGYLASGLVLTTFATNDLRRLRLIAILSNLAFIAYGGLAWLPPVLLLHLLLLPLNVLRLADLGKVSGNPAPAAMMLSQWWSRRCEDLRWAMSPPALRPGGGSSTALAPRNTCTQTDEPLELGRASQLACSRL